MHSKFICLEMFPSHEIFLRVCQIFFKPQIILTAGGDGSAVPLHGGVSAPRAGLHGAHLQAGDLRLRDRGGGGAEAGGGQGDPHLCGGGLHQHEQENILVNNKSGKYLTHTKKYFIGYFVQQIDLRSQKTSVK